MARRALLWILLVATVAALGAIGAASWRAVGSRPAPREPGPVELRVAAWVAEGLRPTGTAASQLAEGWAALAADAAGAGRDAARHFQMALALEPGRVEALAGWILASASADDAELEELRDGHALAAWALERNPGRGDLLAAWSRILLLVPGRGPAEASEAARKAVEAGGGTEALLALSAARLGSDPAAAAEAAEKALAQASADRRPLLAAARARWQAGEARAALAHLEKRLAVDPAHPAALALQVEILGAVGRLAEARQVLRRWAAPGTSALPVLLQAMLAYQVEGDMGEGRRLLLRARALPGDDLLQARVLAHLAALERVGGDAEGAARLVGQALARAPGSAPARYQQALLAFAAGDAALHRAAAGALAGRGGERLERELAARTAELAGRKDEAVAAWEDLAAGSRDAVFLLRAAGAEVRLGATGRAVALLRRAAAIDAAAGRGPRAVTDFWVGPPALAAAAAELGSAFAADDPQAGLALASAATCELLLGRLAAAEALAGRAAALAPQSARPRLVRAQAHLDRGQPAEALREAAAAVDAEPQDAVGLEIMARALEGLGRGDALGARARALAVDPRLAGARLGNARRLLRDGQREPARLALRQLLADEPEQPQARALLYEAEARGR
ncbi:MAG: hypothetical protein HZB56_16325 [Deltaproteobacteria bacterium]|nr:hypothetical protein [Deltaproteobacteria bacterium]